MTVIGQQTDGDKNITVLLSLNTFVGYVFSLYVSTIANAFNRTQSRY